MQTWADLQLFHVLKYTITRYKHKLAQIVQETATNVHKFWDSCYIRLQHNIADYSV